MEQELKISICGIKHSGKTTAAAELAKILSLPWADTDDILRDLYNSDHNSNLSVREIFHELGETAFRKLEIQALRGIAPFIPVLALGGGTLSNPELNKNDINSLGFICCLDLPDETAYKRIIAEGLPPFLQNEADPFATFCAQNQERRKQFFKYAKSVVIPGETPIETAWKILTAFKGEKK